MALQYGRKCRVGIKKYNELVPRYFDERLNIVFDVVKNSDGMFNTCRISIANLTADSQQFLENAAAFADLNISKVTLEVAYDPTLINPLPAWEVLFNGDLLYVESNNSGTDSYTTIEGGEGARAYQLAFCNRSFGPTAIVQEIFKFVADSIALYNITLCTNFSAVVAKAIGTAVINPNTFATPNTYSRTRPDVSIFLGLTKLGDFGIRQEDLPVSSQNLLDANLDAKFGGKRRGDIKDTSDPSFFGFAMYGYARDFMDRLCARHGLVWFINNNVLEVIPADGGIETGLLIGPTNGLIGSPTKGPNGQVRADMLIRSMISPYRYYDLDSNSVFGTLRARRVRHSGETRGNSWFSSTENDAVGSRVA